jgi:DNA invertase Pin-like site-specific DNA recombinase
MFGKHRRPDPETAEHVYEVDGLTRSLTDLAKLVELLDAHERSFVSVADCP